MITWTASAREEFERHVAALRTRLVAVGADAEEVAGDLRSHVETELMAERIDVATREDVQRVLARMGPMAGDAGEPDGDARDRAAGGGIEGRASGEAGAVASARGSGGDVTGRAGDGGGSGGGAEAGGQGGHARAGAATAAGMGGGAGPGAGSAVEDVRRTSRAATGFMTVFGVVTPTVTLCAEAIFHLCGDGIFDPIPTWGHVLAIALVPVANAIALNHKPASGERGGGAPAWLGALNGAAFAVSLLYALMFLPLAPFAVVGIAFFGFGLMPLSPLTGFISAAVLRRRLRRSGGERDATLRGWWAGVGLAALAMVALETPGLLTHIGVAMAQSEKTETELRGLRLLRAVGDEETLLRMCYSGSVWKNDLTGLLFSMGRRRGSVEEPRVLYYRVTGKPFNHAPAPQAFRAGARDSRDGWEWDSDQAGVSVGQRLKHLSLTQSRIDGVVNGDALTGYMEWTLVFKNDAVSQHEARAQLLLPPGGVVSRLTLWVNGEEQEAAFAGRGEVRAAYEKIVRQRRDPVLVTTKGPDRILMQCFPVPPNGGEMKVRIGITAPLHIEAADTGLLRLPQILEQNFGSTAKLEHAVWLEAGKPLQAGSVAVAGPNSKEMGMTTVVGVAGATALRAEAGGGERPHTLRGTLSPVDFSAGKWVVRATRDPQVVRTASSHAGAPEATIWQRVERAGEGAEASAGESGVATPASTRENALAARAGLPLAVVVDGSAALADDLPEIARAIETLPEATRLSVFFAGDEVEARAAVSPREAAAWLRGRTCLGGQDDLKALGEAWDAVVGGGGAVLWLHGPQACTWQSAEALLQKETRRAGAVEMRAFMVEAGPNAILEKLEGLPKVSAAPRFGRLGEDLSRELSRLTRGEPFAVTRWKEAKTPADAAGAVEKGGHVARLWAAGEVARLATLGSRAKRADATWLASKFQLVTAVSGAVVLESKQQFDEAGLKQVDPDTTPAVPEPATVALMLGGAALGYVIWKRRRGKANRQ